MAETKLDTFKSQLDILRGSINLLFVEIGQHLTPALKGMVKQTIDVVNTFTSLIDGSKSLKEVFVGLSKDSRNSSKYYHQLLQIILKKLEPL